MTVMARPHPLRKGGVERSSGVKVWRCVVVWVGVCWGLWVTVPLSVVPCVSFPFTCVVAVLDQCLARSSFVDFNGVKCC